MLKIWLFTFPGAHCPFSALSHLLHEPAPWGNSELCPHTVLLGLRIVAFIIMYCPQRKWCPCAHNTKKTPLSQDT